MPKVMLYEGPGIESIQRVLENRDKQISLLSKAVICGSAIDRLLWLGGGGGGVDTQ